jgi:hypothetical protein
LGRLASRQSNNNSERSELTAINVLKQKDAVHLVSDGAAYDAKKRLVSVGPKVFPLPHLNAAIGVRGPTVALPILVHFIGHGATSYDGLKRNIVGILKQAQANARTVLGQSVAGAAFEVAIGGISETRGPDAYVVACNDQGVVSPLTQINELGFMPSTPGVDAFIRTQNGKTIDAADFGLNVIELQRAAKFDGVCGVGGFAQITTVRRTGIETKLLHRWPDQIGKPLNDNILTSISGVIGALGVDSLSIADNAVTVPNVATIASHLGIGTGQAIFNFNLSINTTGLSGKIIPIFVSVFSSLSFTATNQAWDANLFINGTQVCDQSGTNGTNYMLAGAVNITGTGSVMTVAVTQNWNCSAFGQIVNGVAFAQAAKR